VVLVKYVAGYENRYQITSDGRVLSLPNSSRKGIRELKQEICKSNHTNYRRIALCTDGKPKRQLVHRLMAIAFIPNPDNKPHINHIDNNGENNFIDPDDLYGPSTNLEWCTCKENTEHSAKQGRQDKVKILATKAAAKKAIKHTEQKIQTNFGNRLIKIAYLNGRCFVTFICMYCGNTYTKRLDTPAITRNGVCTDCFRR